MLRVDFIVLKATPMFASSARGPSRKVFSELIVDTSIDETPSSSVILELATLESPTNSIPDCEADTVAKAVGMLSPNDSSESFEACISDVDKYQSTLNAKKWLVFMESLGQTIEEGKLDFCFRLVHEHEM
eukprot:CCRYP_013720-RB/>CCRYP_013720-RB protein AED:0.46 eAED:1.00 QI:0/0/0/1/0/0/2/0/129